MSPQDATRRVLKGGRLLLAMPPIKHDQIGDKIVSDCFKRSAAAEVSFPQPAGHAGAGRELLSGPDRPLLSGCG